MRHAIVLIIYGFHAMESSSKLYNNEAIAYVQMLSAAIT